MTTLRLLGAFLRRDAAIARSYRFALILELASASTVALLFYFLSRVADGSKLLSLGVPDGKYFPFVIVGVCLLWVLDAGMLGPSSQLRSDQVNGTLEPLLTTPAPPWALVAAGPAYQILKSAGLGVATFLIAVVFMGVHVTTGVGGILLAAAMIVPALAMIVGVGLLLAAITVVVRRAEHVSSFSSVALGLACGVYYPVDVLPSGVQQVARALPPTWFFDLERAALFGGDIAAGKLAGLIGTAVVMPIVGAYGLDAALRYARRRGTLTHY